MTALLKRHPPNYTRNPLISFHTQPRSQSNNTSIKTLVQGGNFIEALQLYSKLWNHGFKPDNFTFPYILKASSHLQNPCMGLLLHSHAIKTGFDSNLYVGNSLILFHGQFGYLDVVHQLFEDMPERNIVTWTGVISAFIQNDRFEDGAELFRAMRIAALLDVYAKCGHANFARQHFDELPWRNLVSWNAMISGYNYNGNAQVSLELFVDMQRSEKIQPDSFTIVAVLSSCSSLASSRGGKEIHGYVYRAGFERENFIGNGLIDMYGKCGDMELAQRVFNEMLERDVNSWTALISCYGLNGHGTKAIAIFERMKQTASITPNSVTFIAVLTACSHACLLQDGFQYFKAMSSNFGIEPAMKHYVCMVDMLGRAGQFSEALRFINEMPIRPDSRAWEALIGAASIRGDTAAAEIASKCLLELEPENPDLDVQLSNIHAKAGNWDHVAKIRGRMRSNKLQKSPGLSWIETLG
ncbi:Pentatricopeptide repeat [Cinnamomum micranthum f. kanehirae]|uniref:Pentatricopeptide repeat n=1 Tax=Cinnamomum micranthum f. kanehirae TaxID=337451 RepID=A0A3S3NQE4_9MAGN|nr:Pentatricopeptide repeat [Cinnamomum micranthum f. kanehirae]